MEVILSPGVLPVPTCYASEQERFNAYVDAILASISGGIQWTASSTAPTDLTNYWLRLDSNGRPVEALKYSVTDGGWTRWVSEISIGTGGGGSNIFTCTCTPAYPSAAAAYQLGRMFLWKAPEANTAAATLNVDGRGAIAIKRQNGDALVAGNIAAGQMVLCMFDGTNFQIINEVYVPPTKSEAHVSDSATNGGLITVPTASNATVEYSHGLGGVPDIVFWYLVCQVANPVNKGGSTQLGYNIGDQILLGSSSPVGDQNNFFAQESDSIKCVIPAADWDTYVPWIPIKGSLSGPNTENRLPITASQWKLRCVAIRYS